MKQGGSIDNGYEQGTQNKHKETQENRQKEKKQELTASTEEGEGERTLDR